MNTQEEFVVETLVVLKLEEFINTIQYKGADAAYTLLDSKWTSYAMTCMARSVITFHNFDINKARTRDIVEEVIARISDGMHEWISEYRFRYVDV